jgi:hypothetical protein
MLQALLLTLCFESGLMDADYLLNYGAQEYLYDSCRVINYVDFSAKLKSGIFYVSGNSVVTGHLNSVVDNQVMYAEFGISAGLSWRCFDAGWSHLCRHSVYAPQSLTDGYNRMSELSCNKIFIRVKKEFAILGK